MEPPQIELIVRLTARMSAAAFATALLLLSFITARHQRRIRHGIHFLWAFIVVHTIHFGAVVWLAAVTSGANIEDRGGWPLMVAVATIFYGSSFAILRLWRGVESRPGAAPGALSAAHAGVAVIALVFLNSYLARAQTLPVYWLPTIGLVVVVATYFVRARAAIAAQERSSAAMAARPGH